MAKEPSAPRKVIRSVKVAGAQARKAIDKSLRTGNTSSSYKQSMPIKPSSAKANAMPKNTPKKAVTKKVDRMVQSTIDKGAANKMKAQGAKVNSAPTSRLSQGRRGK